MEKIERTLGEGLIAFREDWDLSRKEFYEKVGISKNRLSQLENNKNKNSEKTIKEILKHFEVNYYDFLVVYCGYKIDGKSFDSFDELLKYKERLPSIEEIEAEDGRDRTKKDSLLRYDYSRFLDSIDYLQTEASNDERRTITDMVDFYKFRKYDKKTIEDDIKNNLENKNRA